MKTPSAKTRKPRAAKPAAPSPAPAANAEAPIDEPLTFDDDGIKRVQDIIRNARATWFALLGALVFASVTLASVKDISFFVDTVETKLPIVGISVPVVSFFWAGSLLIAALYAYFHLYLELLWQALGDFPARDKTGALLADRIEPRIVADTAMFRGEARFGEAKRRFCDLAFPASEDKWSMVNKSCQSQVLKSERVEPLQRAGRRMRRSFTA